MTEVSTQENRGYTNKQIKASIQNEVDHRFRYILNKIPKSSDRVLDVGCARHSRERRAVGNLRARLVDHVEGSVIGIDILEKEIRKMAEQGYTVSVGNAESLDTLEGKFDVIVAGELIEHLPNPGLFLEAADDRLREGGSLVLSTPNPDGFVFWRKALLNQSNNETHTCWIDPSNLRHLVSVSDTELHLVNWNWLPPSGGISSLIWRFRKRAAAPGYVATFSR